MANAHYIEPEKLIKRVAEELKKIETLKMPDWAKFVKTGPSRERVPMDEDWWYTRSASIFRTVYLRGPIGVNKLRQKYGSKKNRGHKPERFYKASGKIIRVILRQLETAGFVKQAEIGVHKGRIVTNEGRSFLDKTATTLLKADKPKREVKKEKGENGKSKKTKQETKVSKQE